MKAPISDKVKIILQDPIKAKELVDNIIGRKNNKMVNYTVGFAFNDTAEKILLLQKIKKKGLEWMEGKWNGLGGHIEVGETPRACMVREFEEECGIKTTEDYWTEFAVLCGKDYNVYCFYTRLLPNQIDEYVQKEQEKLQICKTDCDSPNTNHQSYHDMNVMPNLKFLIPLALNCQYMKKPVWFFDAVGDGSHE